MKLNRLNRDFSKTKYNKVYKITNINGESFIVNNLKFFCIERNLNYPTIYNLVRNKNLKNKEGWEVEIIKNKIII